MDTTTAGFDDEVFGHGLPEAARLCILDAGIVRSAEPLLALEFLRRARQIAPEHPATLIALYRFHFYGHQLREARAIAEQSLALGARSLGLPECWQDVPAVAMSGARYDASTRFYLFALKGYAYLSLRLGEPEVAAPALAMLHTLDPDDYVGGKLLTVVMARAGRDEDESDDHEESPHSRQLELVP